MSNTRYITEEQARIERLEIKVKELNETVDFLGKSLVALIAKNNKILDLVLKGGDNEN